MEVTMKTALITAIEDIASLAPSDKQQVNGKKLYTMVHTRVEAFRKNFGENSRIITEIIDCDLQVVRMKATASVKADGEWVVLGTGHAEEFRANGPVNKTSALENCETSCIGRCLANLALHGGEFASSFEVDNAINSKPAPPDLKTGFNIKGSQGTVTANLPTPDTFFATFRVMASDPEKKEHRALYEANKDVIQAALKKATEDSLESTVSGINKMISAYEQ